MRNQKSLIQLICAALLLVTVVAVGQMLADEAYYESWEQSRTDNREVSWMQEPVLHKLRKQYRF
jgi:hypothetical protein